MAYEPQFVPPRAPPAASAGVNHLKSLPTLSTMMIVHGGFVLLWALFCIFAVVIGIINVSMIAPGKTEDAIVIVLYTVFGSAASIVGISNIVAGARIRQLRSKKLAIAALIGGAVSFFCGNVFCLPLTVGVLIYGIMVLTDARVSAAFRRVEAGEQAERIVAEP